MPTQSSRNRILQIRIPNELKERLEAHRTETGAPVSEIVRRAVDAYLRATTAPKEQG